MKSIQTLPWPWPAWASRQGSWEFAVRASLLVVLYALALSLSLWFAYGFRFDFQLDANLHYERLLVWTWLVPLQLVLLTMFHQLTPLLGYFSTPDLGRVFRALALASIVALAVWWLYGSGLAPPRGVIAIDFTLALVSLPAIRLALRVARERKPAPSPVARRRPRPIGIIGAGDAGALLVHELALRPALGLHPVAFFDDDPRKWRSRVHDIPVLGAPELIQKWSGRLKLREAIIAMPSAPAKRVGEIVRMLRTSHLEFRTVPSLDQLALGQVSVSRLRKVEVQDLLGRERIEVEMESIRRVVQDQVVLVTGAGGSIGRELCRQIATHQPGKLLLLDRSEPNLFQIQQELIGKGFDQFLEPLVADLLDRGRMEHIFSHFRPRVVFHAAAHKHVPLMEQQPGEALKNNAFGTARLAQQALKHAVARFVLISTDKAINPASVMGATKRLAEIYIQALSAAFPGRTRFIAVRFGNVLGSSGSVIPIFERQIAEGGPVRVTHPGMTRYFMTIPEAAMLVLQSATQGLGGEIFVLEMGNPVRILDLARQMIELSGLKPDEDIQIEFSGIRPGEKLFEELTYRGEEFIPTTHSKIRRFVSRPAPLTEVRKRFRGLAREANRLPPADFKRCLQQALPEYTPFQKPSASTGPQLLPPR